MPGAQKNGAPFGAPPWFAFVSARVGHSKLGLAPRFNRGYGQESDPQQASP